MLQVCNKSDNRALLRTMNVLDRDESEPDEMHDRDAESSNQSMRD
jgi:hypothetical protein